jgi:hypothetical protein
MATDSDFWKDLEAQFRSLPDPRGQMRVLLDEGLWHVSDDAHVDAGRRRLHAEFEDWARRAAIKSGVPNKENAFYGWLNLLREESPHFRVLFGRKGNGDETDGGYIKNVALASAEYCTKRGTLALELEVAAMNSGSTPGLRRDRYPFSSWLDYHPHEPLDDPKAELDYWKAHIVSGYNSLIDNYARLGMGSWANRHEKLNQTVRGLSYDLAVLQANYVLDQGFAAEKAMQIFRHESVELLREVTSLWRTGCERLTTSFSNPSGEIKGLAKPFQRVSDDLRQLLALLPERKLAGDVEGEGNVKTASTSGELPTAKKRPRKRNEQLETVRSLVRRLGNEGCSPGEICKRLAKHPPPPKAGWKGSSWPEYYLQNPGAVQTWISKVLKSRPITVAKLRQATHP